MNFFVKREENKETQSFENPDLIGFFSRVTKMLILRVVKMVHARKKVLFSDFAGLSQSMVLEVLG